MSARVTSAVWVSAYVRRCAVAGAPAYVMRRGAEAAGAIYIKVNRLDGTALVLAPAPQALLADAPASRAWTPWRGDAVPEAEADAYLAREARFDPDLWLVEIEDRQGRHFLLLSEIARDEGAPG
jgi:hypothetical protein